VSKGGAKISSISDQMNVVGRNTKLVDLHNRQASGYDNSGIRINLPCSSDILAALGRSGVSYAAGVDNQKVRLFGRFGLLKAEIFEQLSDLLALILIDFTAKSIY
jgi:hypothetical protein